VATNKVEIELELSGADEAIEGLEGIGETSKAMAERFNLNPAAHRIVVSSVDRSSQAYMAGLRPGDIIKSVDRKEVGSVAQFKAITAKKKAGDLLFLLVERGSSRMYLAFNL
jgi:serine protease Do